MPQTPLIICEGKTDYIYLKCALRRLHTAYPWLITIDQDGIHYHCKFLNYTKAIAEMFGLTGGNGGLANLIRHYKENLSKYTAPNGKPHPVIILIDNDDGGKDILNTIKTALGITTPLDGMQPFYHVTDNLYVVPTPKSSAADKSKIEDFFPLDVQQRTLDRKNFNASNKVDKATEYGKNDFAEKIVKKDMNNIDFSRFAEIFNPISGAMQHYYHNRP